MSFHELTIELNSLTVFRALRADPVLSALTGCLTKAASDPMQAIFFCLI